ncbi:MAG: DoxX family protein [Pseudomonadota bacterium]
MITLYNALCDRLSRADWLLTTVARLIFAGTLLFYFWVSGLTKLGDGLLGLFKPSVGAYAQIFPKAMEAVTYDTSQLTVFHWAVVVAGTWAEFILPALVVLGLLTRLSALGMIGFVIVQSLTDLYGHGGAEHKETLGAWFDRFPDSLILDQRAFWVFLLLVLVLKGGGPLSLDAALRRRTTS